MTASRQLQLNRPTAKVNGRQAERTLVLFAMKVIRQTPTGEKYNDGFCIDISLTGAAFVCEAELSLDDVVELVSGPAGRPAMRRYAWLRYRCGKRYGACFLSPQ